MDLKLWSFGLNFRHKTGLKDCDRFVNNKRPIKTITRIQVVVKIKLMTFGYGP